MTVFIACYIYFNSHYMFYDYMLVVIIEHNKSKIHQVSIVCATTTGPGPERFPGAKYRIEKATHGEGKCIVLTTSGKPSILTFSTKMLSVKILFNSCTGAKRRT